MTNTSALSVSDGNFRLVVGNDLDVSAEEISAVGRTVRFGPRELVALARLMGEAGIGKASTHGLLVVSDDLNPEVGGEVHVSSGGGELGGLLRASSEEQLAVVLTEAVARGWFHTLSLAGSGPLAWTREDSEHIGHLGIQGRPLLSEYLAERRRAVRGGGYSAQEPAAIPADDESAREVLCSLLEESGSRTQFGAAELAVAGDRELRAIVRAATSEGEWLDNLRLALAAEEALAADLLLEVLAAMRHKTGPLERWTRLRAAIAARVLACRGRVPIFEEVLDRLERAPESMWDQVFRRGKVKSTRYVGEDVAAYLNVFTEPEEDGAPDAATAKRMLEDLEAGADDDMVSNFGSALVQYSAADRDGQQGERSDKAPTFEDLARALGEEFARRLPIIEGKLNGLRESHPDEDEGARLTRWRQVTLADLDSLDTEAEDSRELASETVIDYVLARSLLTGVPTGTDKDLAHLGNYMLRAAVWSVKARQKAAPAAGAAVGLAVHKVWPAVQVALMELVFNQLSRFNPAGQGLPRQVFTFARSKVRRARRETWGRNAAVSNAEHVAQTVVDRTSNRLLLVAIDRLVRKLER